MNALKYKTSEDCTIKHPKCQWNDLLTNSFFIRKGYEMFGEPFNKDRFYNLHLCVPGSLSFMLFSLNPPAF